MKRSQNLFTITRHLTSLLRRMENEDFSTPSEDRAIRAAIAHLHAGADLLCAARAVTHYEHFSDGYGASDAGYNALAELDEAVAAVEAL